MKRDLCLQLAVASALACIASAYHQSCITSLEAIVTTEAVIVDYAAMREYTLCPNTTFTISENRGQTPLLLARPNVHVRCGLSGESSNNCLLQGGHFQVRLYNDHNITAPINNVKIQGLTFTDAITYNILAEDYGELFLVDCIFRHNEAKAIVQASHKILDTSVQLRRRRSWSSTPTLRLTIESCVFRDNTIFPWSGVQSEGLIMIEGKVTLEVKKSLFLGNKATADFNLPYMVGGREGTLRIRESCFLSNDNIVPVVVDGTDVELKDNFVGNDKTSSMATGCEFVANLTVGSIYTPHGNEYECLKADRRTCSSNFGDQEQIHCIISLAHIEAAEDVLESFELTRTYVLCPHTDYVGNHKSAASLTIDKPNVRLLCGIQGKSSSSCILKGGYVQLLVHNVLGTSEPTDNVYISGLSFTEAHTVNMLTTFPGPVELFDCVFRNNNNLANVFVASETDHPALSLFVSLHAKSSHRLGTTPQVTIRESLFEDNTIGSFFGQSGLVTSRNSNLAIAGSVFRRTSNVADFGDVSYLVGSTGGSAQLTQNCFDSNHVSLAPIMIHSSSKKFSDNAAFDTETYYCNSILDIRSEEPSMNALSFLCVPFDNRRETC